MKNKWKPLENQRKPRKTKRTTRVPGPEEGSTSASGATVTEAPKAHARARLMLVKSARIAPIFPMDSAVLLTGLFWQNKLPPSLPPPYSSSTLLKGSAKKITDGRFSAKTTTYRTENPAIGRKFCVESDFEGPRAVRGQFWVVLVVFLIFWGTLYIPKIPILNE